MTGVTALLSAVTLVLCIVMTIHSLNGSGLVGCGAGSSCDSVMSGRWSRLFGFFPVSGLATGLYAAVLLCLTCILFSKEEETLRLARMSMLLFAGAIFGSALWFISLQAFVEGSFCKYCMSAHILGIAIAVLSLIAFLPLEKRGAWLFAAGVGLAAVLVFIQLFASPDYVYQEGHSEKDLPVIEASGHPVVGNPESAEHVINLLFDYQCNHCQKLHGILPEVVDAFDGKVAFVLCPSPLSPKCNPYIPREETHFEGSCDFARIGMALYSIDSAAFSAFDSWVFEEPEQGKWSPKPLADAYVMASGLVGADTLDTAMGGDSVRDFLNRTIELFGRTTIAGQGGIPRFVYGNKWVVPEADDIEGIVEVLKVEFGI